VCAYIFLVSLVFLVHSSYDYVIAVLNCIASKCSIRTLAWYIFVYFFLLINNIFQMKYNKSNKYKYKKHTHEAE